MASAATAGVRFATSTRYSARKPVNTSTSRSATSISSSQRSVPQSRSAAPISRTRAVHGCRSASSVSAAAGRPSASGRPRSRAPSQISALIPASTRKPARQPPPLASTAVSSSGPATAPAAPARSQRAMTWACRCGQASMISAWVSDTNAPDAG